LIRIYFNFIPDTIGHQTVCDSSFFILVNVCFCCAINTSQSFSGPGKTGYYLPVLSQVAFTALYEVLPLLDELPVNYGVIVCICWSISTQRLCEFHLSNTYKLLTYHLLAYNHIGRDSVVAGGQFLFPMAVYFGRTFSFESTNFKAGKFLFCGQFSGKI